MEPVAAANVDLSSFEIDDQVRRIFPPELVHRHKIVPVKLNGDTLYIACCDPSMEILRKEVGVLRRRKTVVPEAEQSEVEEAIRRYYH